jgi:hypothetical protein
MKYTIQGIIKRADKRASREEIIFKSKKSRVDLTIEFLNKNAISKDTIWNHRKDPKANFNEDPFDQETIEILKSINYTR